jgi:hypothetical protein
LGIISDFHKWMFVHIPKNAGLSTYLFLVGHLAQGDIVIMEGVVDPCVISENVVLEKHSPARRYRAWMSETGRDWDEYLSFAVIRDPLTRPQSVYGEIKRRERHWARQEAGEEWWASFAQTSGVDDFITRGLYSPDGPLMITGKQWDFVAQDGDQIVKHLLPFDGFAEMLPGLLGLSGHIGVHANRAGYVPVELSDEAKAYLHEHYADDFTLYDSVRSAS